MCVFYLWLHSWRNKQIIFGPFHVWFIQYTTVRTSPVLTCKLRGSHMWNKTEIKHSRWCSREIKHYFISVLFHVVRRALHDNTDKMYCLLLLEVGRYRLYRYRDISPISIKSFQYRRQSETDRAFTSGFWRDVTRYHIVKWHLTLLVFKLTLNSREKCDLIMTIYR